MKSIEETSTKKIELSFENKIQTISKANLILRFGHTQNQNQNQFAPIVAN